MMPPYKRSFTSGIEERESALGKISLLLLQWPAKPSQTTALEFAAAPAGAACPAKDRGAVPSHSPTHGAAAPRHATFRAWRRTRPRSVHLAGHLSTSPSFMHSQSLQFFPRHAHRAKHA